MKKLWIVLLAFLTGCLEIPEGVQPQKHFELNRYLGTWYEIVRLEHRFEKGMEGISATYSMREDGGVRVLNKGYRVKEQEWKEAEGKAYFVDDPKTAHLKVSFFGPFYGSYIVLDTDYESYTMITSNDKSYFWILARTPKLEENVLNRLIGKAKTLGFDTESLIYVDQSLNIP